VYVQTSTIGDLMIEINVTVYMTKVIEDDEGNRRFHVNYTTNMHFFVVDMFGGKHKLHMFTAQHKI